MGDRRFRTGVAMTLDEADVHAARCTLSRWYRDVRARIASWTRDRNLFHPKTVCRFGRLEGTPKAFITAVQQVYARANQLPLDVMRP